MKKKLLLFSLVATTLLAFAAKDPVLMTINGKDVKLSEFEYLYHKNSAQQIQKESLDEYIDRFVNYKLKVADAEAMGLDTLESFKKELEGYKRSIVLPFLRDTTVYDSLVLDAFDRTQHSVEVTHIMRPLGTGVFDGIKEQMLIDSIYNELQNGANFEEMVQKYSVDRSKYRNNGNQGFVYPGRFPIAFENATYDTPVGQISKPFETPYGWHIVKPLSDKKNEGTVLVEHILKLFGTQPGTAPSDSVRRATKAKIDAVYNRIKAGEDFETVAKAESEDPGSAQNGGKLPWFGVGRMVKPFEETSFKLAVGEVSEPFETAYGYHIVKKLDSKPNPPLEEVREQLREEVKGDERTAVPRLVRNEQLKKELNYQISPKFSTYIDEALNAYGSYDSVFVANMLGKSDFVFCTFDNVKVPVSRLATRLTTKESADIPTAKWYIMKVADEFGIEEMRRHYSNTLIDKNADFANLFNEYHDGMLLFEASSRKVWDAASTDTTGLKDYFNAHRADFTWDTPHFKGIILHAKNDSVLNCVKQDVALWGHSDSLTLKLSEKYRNDIKMQRMLVAKGENAVADYLMFNGEKALPNDKRFTASMVLEGGIQMQPETMNDVRGQVTSAYQDELEQLWIKELREKYPVKIDKKIRKKIK